MLMKLLWKLCAEESLAKSGDYLDDVSNVSSGERAKANVPVRYSADC